MTYIGIDPGLSGAIAVIEEDPLGNLGVLTYAMPTFRDGKKNYVDPVVLTRILSEVRGEPKVLMEKVSARPGQGVTSMFSFGESYGTAKGVIGCLGYPLELVAPQTWKRQVLSDYDYKGRKAASIEWCRDKFPDVDLRKNERCRTDHDGIADALCLAWLCRV